MAIQKAPPPPSRPEPNGDTFQLQLSSGNGPVYRTVLRTPPRDATPAEIPIIDISGIFSASLHDRKAVAGQIHAAATNNGFFYIRNHGVPASVTDAAHAGCLSFFRQPQGVKSLADARQSAYFNGYKPPRTQRINPSESVDNRETFSWTYDPRCDPAVPSLDSVPPRVRSFLRIEPDEDEDTNDAGSPGGGEGETEDQIYLSRFPWSRTKTVSHFAPAVIEYWRSCLTLARALVRSFALSLDLEETFFDSKVTHPDAALALNYYPPLPPTPPRSPEHFQAPSPASSSSPSPSPPPQARPTQQEQEQVSIGSHTDFQLFTILCQDAVPGLQVLSREGQWLNAPPVPGTFVVNIADYLQRITNDLYVSTVHRAINNGGSTSSTSHHNNQKKQSQNHTGERVSMPFFFGFNMDESCAVLDSCVAASPGGVRRYDEVSCHEWVQRRVKAMHDTRGKEEGARG